MAADLINGEVPSHWEFTTLGEACRLGGGNIQTGPFGSQLHASDYVPLGIPSIMPTNIGDNRIIEDGIVRITEADANRLSQHRVKPGDIIYSRRGDVEKRALIRERETGWLCGTGCLKVRLGAGVVDPVYASFFLGHPSIREWIVRHAIGATMPNLNTSIMSNVPFALPPMDEQRAIAHILGTLDDKIELNRRMNETLESMGRALFKSWFVDFDPVRAKADILTREGVLEIGDGYRAKNSELGESGLPFIRAGNLNNGFDTYGAEILSDSSVAKAGNKISRPGDVAFTSKGTIGRFARVTKHTEPFVYSPQVCYWRSLDKQRINSEILYCWMRSEDFLCQVSAVAGQTDMAPYVSLRDQRQMEVPIFPESQHAVAEQIRPLFDRQAILTLENKTLASLRDNLLLRLISGELRIADAEHIKETAT